MEAAFGLSVGIGIEPGIHVARRETRCLHDVDREGAIRVDHYGSALADGGGSSVGEGGDGSEVAGDGHREPLMRAELADEWSFGWPAGATELPPIEPP